MLGAKKTLWAICAAATICLAGCSESSQPAIEETAATDSSPGLAHGRIRFVEGYRRGCEVARAQGKPVLLFFTATWCDYCHAMARDAFCQEPVVNLSQQFVCVLVDADAEPDVCRQFRVRGYPTIQFLSPRGMPLNRITGKQPGHQLVMEMQAALQAIARHVDDRATTKSL
jgi:thiol:disulfide interchange protein